MRNLAASQFEPAVASRRSQRVPSIKPREVVAWASRTRCRVTVRRLCTARTVASAAKRHFLTFLDFYGDLRTNGKAAPWLLICAKLRALRRVVAAHSAWTVRGGELVHFLRLSADMMPCI